MSSRISDLLGAGLACLALAACGGQGANNAAALAGDPVDQAEADDGKADCAIGKGAEWARSCLVERGEGAEGTTLTLRHPDGGFRRFLIVTDGRGIVPADGSEDAKLKADGDKGIEIAVGDDRYRLPATFAAAKK